MGKTFAALLLLALCGCPSDGRRRPSDYTDGRPARFLNDPAPEASR